LTWFFFVANRASKFNFVPIQVPEDWFLGMWKRKKSLYVLSCAIEVGKMMMEDDDDGGG